ncbi:hypothetical protein B0H16DRAFT_1798180 [Mycena metata]|uniref:Uncharacterized protein n=1 Tax=Mycena metata TaxID=1033252 RepID=A0AAD7JKK4_9AGAR|nr:hypothetical protein B0H16DRAFT_1798180 [Mycena metata]
MAELAVGVLGAVATVGAAQLTTAAGFSGRHERTHHQETMETKRNTEEFLANVRIGDITQAEEREFMRVRDEAIRQQNEYHELIQSYKRVSRFNIPRKLKKQGKVRRAKRSIQETNHSLRNLNEAMSSGSDASSTHASSGSPPGSNLATEDIQGWTNAVGRTINSSDSDSEEDLPDDSRVTQTINQFQDEDAGSLSARQETLSGNHAEVNKTTVYCETRRDERVRDGKRQG